MLPEMSSVGVSVKRRPAEAVRTKSVNGGVEQHDDDCLSGAVTGGVDVW